MASETMFAQVIHAGAAHFEKKAVAAPRLLYVWAPSGRTAHFHDHGVGLHGGVPKHMVRCRPITFSLILLPKLFYTVTG